MYHFNYFISLITGIFDALALITKDQYNLNFRGDNYPQRTSLNPLAGGNFLKALKKRNSTLREHINEHVNFIKLIYELRELVIHRKMLEKTQLKIHPINSDKIQIKKDEGWKMNCILIDKSILNFIGRNTNKIQKYKSVTEWGIYQFEDDSILLEPFDFSKMVLKKLINFSNEYLNILGYKRYLDEVKDVNPQDLYVLSIEAFKNGKLGL